ncbi:DUF2251 domain-containing protein [Vibrio cholerae]|uniref:DUF2251 domain-containing protein n=2 Tax=Vibrio kanaloae TaxID=170673 RepID=A0A4U1Z2L0_9VIBR|nr:predicted protein [Vibrio cholerae RC385]EKF9423045.1 DUF2251 domain-containing protein [Vibrio cholerae]TKE95496.1 DUF2251 domain-containing protein [Vibrio kanaloae]TKF18091.1 DUF2251 domain-containing protein [Vibrio kanaloae]TKF26447.1 DUF2251 domain-containing protein [Vibrio kanaloae]
MQDKLIKLGRGNMSQLIVSGFKTESICMGSKLRFGSESPIGRYEAIFEDDGSTGYLYLMDSEKEGNPIITAFGIYQSDYPDDENVTASILWGEDATKVALLINGVAQAYFDFSVYRGTCKTEYCPVKTNIDFYDWDEQFMEHFLE